MKTDESQGTFEGILAGHTPEVATLARALRRLIATVHPTAFEIPRKGERCTTYGIGRRKMPDAYAHIMPLTDAVNLGLYHGADLPDPNGLLKGVGKGLRHMRVTSMKDVTNPATVAFIRGALADRLDASGQGQT